MAPQKRKRPHDVAAEPETQPQPPPRRATRQHPEAGASTAQPEHQLRSGRVRANTLEKPTTTELNPVTAPAKKDDATNTTAPTIALPMRKTRTTRHTAAVPVQDSSVVTATATASKENIRPATPPKARNAAPSSSPSSSRHPLQSLPSPPLPKPIAQAHSTPQTRVPPQPPRPTQSLPRPSAATSASVSTAARTPNRNPSNSNQPPKPPPTPRSDRNIDKVVFGDICFKAWYPSYYGKEVLGDASGNGAGSKDAGNGGGGAKLAKMGGGKREPPMLDRLYVCPCCFKYSRELVLWWEHVRCCERRAEVPGRKVYTHPRETREDAARRMGVGGKGKGRGRKKSDVGLHGAEEKGADRAEWSVWEVDGEKDMLFCQNLSLFAKLFLDNKSVFFDVAGFHYFLLVYTPSPTEPTPRPPSSSSLTDITRDQPPHVPSPPPPPRPQIVGFFSKEKMSWDNNNLACILVFPPWQRKGLGALLMGVSYEISRREGILGGPEKPISELGRKGYKRFWAGEIARWILGLDVPLRDGEKEKETLVDVAECSRATWIVPEDCLAVLRELGVVEEAGPGPRKDANAVADTDVVGDDDAEAVVAQGPETEESLQQQHHHQQVVPRVRVDKAAVRRWVEANKIDLTRTCDPDGFVEGYAIAAVEEVQGEEMEE